MEQQSARLRNTGFLTFFFSGICAISAGVVVSLLQERYGFAYGMTGTLLSLMSVGNLLAGLLIGMLPSVLGMKPSVLLLTIGYAVGYGIMGLTGAVAVLALAFFLVGIAKGSVMNTCTILVSDNSASRTRRRTCPANGTTAHRTGGNGKPPLRDACNNGPKKALRYPCRRSHVFLPVSTASYPVLLRPRQAPGQ